MKVAVTTLAFAEISYLKYTAAINRAYCARHGYEFRIIHAPEQVLRSPIWYKVDGVRALLRDFDLVMFLDADAYFVDAERSVTDLAQEFMGEAAVLCGADRRDKEFAWSDSNANCGVFLVRKCPRACEILDEWWESPLRDDRKWLWAWPPEQGAFNAYVRNERNADAIKVIYYAHMNGVDGTFVRHLIGMTEEQRLSLLREQVETMVADCSAAGSVALPKVIVPGEISTRQLASTTARWV